MGIEPTLKAERPALRGASAGRADTGMEGGECRNYT